MVPEPHGSGGAASDSLSLAFAALADPTRRAILARLAKGEASVAELAEPFDMTVRAVSKHIGVLQRAGLVARGKDGQRRPSRIQPVALRKAHAWLDRYRRLWDKRFDQIDAVLESLQRETSRDSRR